MVELVLFHRLRVGIKFYAEVLERRSWALLAICPCSRISSFGSILLRNSAIFHVRRLFNSAAVNSDDYYVFDENPYSVQVNVIGDVKLYAFVVKVIKSLCLNFAKKIKFSVAVRHYGVSHSLDAFKIIVHVFASAGMRVEVYDLLRDLVCFWRYAKHDVSELFPKLLDSPRNVASSIVVSELIKVFAANSMLENAVDVFVQTKKIGPEPYISSCNFLLKCLIEANKGEFACSLFKALKFSGPSPNIYTYTIMINFYCKGQHGRKVDIERATEIVQEIEKIGESPTVVTYSTYIHGLWKVGCPDTAWDTIQNLKFENKPLNAHCYNAVIKGFCQKGDMVEASKVSEEMKRYGMSPDVYSYSIFIDWFCKKGDIKQGLNLIEKMGHQQIKPSVVSYSSLFYGLCKSGLVDISQDMLHSLVNNGYEYLRLLEEMVGNNSTPSATAADFYTLIQGFYKIGLLDMALEAFKIMLQCGVLPNTMTCNFIVDGHCWEGHLDDALKLMHDMQDQGVILNSYTYNAVISRLCREGKPEKALELFPMMFKRNIFPEVEIYSTLMDGFAKQSDYKKAFWLYERMLKFGVPPDTVAVR